MYRSSGIDFPNNNCYYIIYYLHKSWKFGIRENLKHMCWGLRNNQLGTFLGHISDSKLKEPQKESQLTEFSFSYIFTYNLFKINSHL